MADDDTFVRITNKDIYQAIMDMKKDNATQHSEIVLHQQQTNGKVKLNRWIATTAMTLAISAIGWIVASL